MQGVASLVAMPHKTTETRSSVGPASSTEVKVGTDKNSPSLPNPTEAKGAEGIAVCLLLFENNQQQKTSVPQASVNQQEEAKNNASKNPGTSHIRDLFLSFDKVPIVLSSSHASTAQKSTRFIQDGDRYIFLVEDNRTSKVSSVSSGTDARSAKASDEAAEETVPEEEAEDDEFSDGGSEASLEDVRQHHGIIKTQKQDDPDYLTLFEAHQRRLEDVGSPTPGQG
ncbi:uncharacterized protein LOC110063102 [Orbicella faveolata]|uniref:uncharacterized protein LOC110063102 n=1 Tax=Orbicella faveolata TaxID=48498 RepID=UPI0009E3182F|nr:uncharacterized protein LOC110063102 [Orbicella faveolata]